MYKLEEVTSISEFISGILSHLFAMEPKTQVLTKDKVCQSYNLSC